MTSREQIYDVIEMFSQYADSSLLSNEHIFFKIKNKRSTYLKNYISNLKKEIPLQAMQTICFTFEEDDLCEDDFLVLKSTEKLPSTIESTGRSNISQAYLPSRIAKWINIIGYERFPYLKSGGRFINKQIYITLDPEDYILIYSPSGNHELIEDLKLNIVAEDPEEAYKLQCDLNAECDFLDAEFPMPRDMADAISREIVNEFLIKYRIPVDTVNNAEPDEINKGTTIDNARGRRPDIN
jgi:hypothetical protein